MYDLLSISHPEICENRAVAWASSKSTSLLKIAENICKAIIDGHSTGWNVHDDEIVEFYPLIIPDLYRVTQSPTIVIKELFHVLE